MKIGTAVTVLPLCHPLRLAEEIATIDQLADGRLIFGVGRSGFAHTYRTYGVDYAESRERFAETLEIVKGCFAEERFSHKGRFYTIPPEIPYRGYTLKEITLVPRPQRLPV